MNIPQIDQDLATIKSMEIQHRNGFHMSTTDRAQLKKAMQNINHLVKEITEKN